jgi:FkbM family methyltransferase
VRSLKYGGMDFAYRNADHLISLAEVLLMDSYRADMLKKGYTVIDLGAGIGDFSVLASRRVGPDGKVIALEPNMEDYDLLKVNIERNRCANVVALNMGVADKPGKKEITFWDRTYSFMADTLENILASLEVKKINFIKMDIEGFEAGVIRSSIGVIEQTDVISMELHGTKGIVDETLRSCQFVFMPADILNACERLISSMVSHPRAAFEILLFAARAYPKIVRMRMNEARHDNRLITGVYVKPAARDLVIQ